MQVDRLQRLGLLVQNLLDDVACVMERAGVSVHADMGWEGCRAWLQGNEAQPAGLEDRARNTVIGCFTGF